MTMMGSYCKAYLLRELRTFTHWHENGYSARKEKVDHTEKQMPRTLTDDDYLFLQANYVVTDGLFMDKNIVFDEVTDEWIDFCRHTLLFELPSRETTTIVVKRPYCHK